MSEKIIENFEYNNNKKYSVVYRDLTTEEDDEPVLELISRKEIVSNEIEIEYLKTEIQDLKTRIINLEQEALKKAG